jgi:hypothetical protein
MCCDVAMSAWIGGWWLVVGGWWLVVGDWWLVVGGCGMQFLFVSLIHLFSRFFFL